MAEPQKFDTPTPAYGYAASDIIGRAVFRTIKFPLICVAIATLTAPIYTVGYAAFTAHLAGPIAGAGWRPSWTTTDDVWFAIGLTISLACIYALENGFFAICDKYELMQQYKMYRSPPQEPSPALVAKTLKKEAVSHLLTGPVLMFFFVGPFLRWNAPVSAVDPAAIPDPWSLYTTFTICLLLNETMFYFGHRLLHTKTLYKMIHKQHHEYIGTRSFAAEYAHAAEDVLTGYLPYLAGLCLTGAHFHTTNVWFFCRLMETYEAHSGYCFKDTVLDTVGILNAHSSANHDFHHTNNTGNYGWEIFDWAFGTMDAYVRVGCIDGYLAKAAAARGSKKGKAQ
jgi:sterol desaturase/sphingolipid hydroxylase (fatty acid hydroxylase superfamily)